MPDHEETRVETQTYVAYFQPRETDCLLRDVRKFFLVIFSAKYSIDIK